MKRLQETTETIISLEKTSAKILKRIHPIMEEISYKENESDIIDEIAYRTDMEDNKSEVIKQLQETILKVIENAEEVHKEINIFAEKVTEGVEEISKHIDDYPFLADVWYGDHYDNKEGLDALKELLTELKDDLKYTDVDKLTKHVCLLIGKTKKL